MKVISLIGDGKCGLTAGKAYEVRDEPEYGGGGVVVIDDEGDSHALTSENFLTREQVIAGIERFAKMANTLEITVAEIPSVLSVNRAGYREGVRSAAEALRSVDK